jgi:hypothetical protein
MIINKKNDKIDIAAELLSTFKALGDQGANQLSAAPIWKQILN